MLKLLGTFESLTYGAVGAQGQGVPHMRMSRITAVTLLFAVVLFTTDSQASVDKVGIDAFGAGSTLTTFTGLPDGTEVNGLTVDGITFSYSLGAGKVVIDGGPGITNNIDPPNIVSEGDNTGVLSMTLPSSVTLFGYGYAMGSVGSVLNATTISLFSGPPLVGSLSYDGVPDPLFTG